MSLPDLSPDRLPDDLYDDRAVHRAEALAARAARDPNRAVKAWRTMLDGAPDDWRVALELKADLKAGWHYPDSDGRFRRAARGLPDEDWLAHYAGLYAFHGSDLDVIDGRAQALLARWPNEARLHAIRGDVARQRRDWRGAVQAFAQAARLDPSHPDYPAKAAAGAVYQTLAGRRWPEHGPRYTVAVVNLDRNTERMAEIERQFAGTPVPMHRVAAVEGSRLPGAAVERLAGTATAPRGTLGCFLSHAAAWEALLLRGDSHALIVEDDVIPLLSLPQQLGGLGIPDGFDVCFVNDRLEPKPGAGPGFTAVPMAAVMRGFNPDDNAPGTDGYILSRDGAAKLLNWVAADGMADDVDWRTVAYAMTPDDIAAMPAHSHARRELSRIGAANPRPERLRAYALYPALIRTVGVSSDREDENRLHES